MNRTGRTAYDFDCTDLRGRPLPLAKFSGQPLLIVNTASHCFFARQFPDLEKLWQDHRVAGLVVIGVPSNDFGQQEPHDNAMIATLCESKIGISFPLLAKTPVKGQDALPLFQWLADEGGYLARPRHNFYKYIVGSDGHLQDWFSSLTPITSPRFTRAIERALAKTV